MRHAGGGSAAPGHTIEKELTMSEQMSLSNELRKQRKAEEEKLIKVDGNRVIITLDNGEIRIDNLHAGVRVHVHFHRHSPKFIHTASNEFFIEPNEGIPGYYSDKRSPIDET
jgi:hypothetical protein